MDSDTQYTFHVALINPGKIIQSIFALAEEYDLQAFFPEVRIQALTDEDLNEKQKSIIQATGAEIYSDYHEMLRKAKGIDTVVLLRDNPELLQELRHKVHGETTIIDYRTAWFMWEIIIQERLCLSCQSHLTHARNLLRTILDEVHDDILLMDRDQLVIDVNKNVYQELEMDKDEILGKYCWETWTSKGMDAPCDGEDYPCPFHYVLESGEKAEALHTRVDKHGRLKYFRIYIYPIKNFQNRITHMLEMRRDITNRTYMEKRLQQSEKMAAIGELSTYIAHEIRNPLFAIGGFANSLLRMDELGSKARQKAQIILNESKRLDGILKSILNFSRPTEAETSEVYINEIVRQTMDLMGIGCRKQEIVVNQYLQEGLPQAKANPELIKQSLINIVKNAMETMPHGGRMDIKTSICDEHICIMVIDSGPGISPELQEKIFNPFFSTKEKGSGLGLAMTKKTVEDMGGQVELQSKEGEGTCVTIFLPPALALQEQKEKNIQI